MKMTWKKNVNDSRIKTRKRPISSNPNLPLEDVNSSSDANSAAQTLKEGDLLGKGGLPDKKVMTSDEEAEERRNLAGDFEAQGNNLAEVSPFSLGRRWIFVLSVKIGFFMVYDASVMLGLLNSVF